MTPMSKPALWATRWSPSANSTRSGSCSAHPSASAQSEATMPWMRVFHSRKASYPSGGLMYQEALSTTRPSRTFTSPTEQALALEELAVSKSIAVKSSGTSSCSHGHPTLTDAARSAGHGSLDFRGSHYRNRRTPQRGQVDSLQRPDQELGARRELPVRHDRAERGHRAAARRPPREAGRGVRQRAHPAGPCDLC